ncbi:leucine--tRNA ligase [Flaviflexus salsibiostraticola]|uniref:Leucine--tRNA ligase n=1 Tax=Flaviflexus salsibiostraticola TaxID=1282737 RepID=A0A3S8Z7M5_9ACTO|nr:leucine--tRNA ligase [Flaviflexus salsibiostraticola]AZN29517.1 leucine--tRNA ligase [Flaviflexus salsibiostraticola]
MSETTEHPHRYTAELAGEIESRWQDRWDEEGTYHVPNPVGDLAGDVSPEKFYLLDMFPYPSGKGLHVGHPFGYIATDVVGRFQRMLGKSVLHTMGFDAFGLPAEQYAVQTGQHPRITTEQNIKNMKRQLRQIGLGHDQRRSFATTDVDYVRWTQWIFLQIYNSFYDESAEGRTPGTTGRARPISELIAEFESGHRPVPSGAHWADLSEPERAAIIDDHRLAYISHAPVNWCPGLGTVLANEEVTNEGRSERGNYPVFRRQLRQWMMRITSYADRLAADLDTVDWPEKVVAMQRNWIGRSNGAYVTFAAHGADRDHDLTVFTTRPDTLFGATFMVVSPEHPMLQDGAVPTEWPEGTKDAWTGGAADPRSAVSGYQAAAQKLGDTARTSDEREKTGVFTGIYATNPVNGDQVPVFTADYVLMGYGTGAIMAVPAHDQRDYDFATAFELPIVLTIQPPADFPGDSAYVGDGEVINSANDEFSINGLDKAAAIATVSDYLAEKGTGLPAVTYRLRDWLFSRQRYWGEPFPIVYDEDGRAYDLPESMLPVELPETPDYSPRSYDPDDAESMPEPPLGRLKDWVAVTLDLGDGERTYYRDTNTMPNWAGSCWYELRYLDPNNDEAFAARENEEYWMGPRPEAGNHSGGADLYVGGVEHAVLHLLYARFWHKVLFDLGHVSSSEPFHKLFNQGMIEAYAFTDSRGQYVPADEVETNEENGEQIFTYRGERVSREYGKMGKSLKNTVTPEEISAEYGADTFRVYEMSMGPIEQSRVWEPRAVVGAQRFLQRLWRNIVSEETGETIVADVPVSEETARLAARTVTDVRTEYEAMRPNTAIAKLIVLNNHLTSLDEVPREVAEQLVAMVGPVAPHIAEELWARLGHESSVVYAPFPTIDEALLVEDTVTCVVQVKGKVRDRIDVAAEISDEELTERALALPRIQQFLEGEPRKIIVRAPNLINIVP